MVGVLEGGLGGVSVVVGFLEGIAWYYVGILLWVNVGLLFFCADVVRLEISERGVGDIGDVEGHLG